MVITVRRLRADDAPRWIELRGQLWPGSLDDHRADVARYFESGWPGIDAVFVAESSGRVVGFAELSKRPFAEGCNSSPVGFLEGWFVEPEFRRSGAGRALIAAAEDWCREQGCRELASDSEPENDLALASHVAVGFEEAGLVRCFRKSV